jgi:hypothetical protein
MIIKHTLLFASKAYLLHVGVVVLIGCIEGCLPSSDEGDVHVVTPVGVSYLETYTGWRDVWMALVAWRRSRVLLTWGPRRSDVASTIYDDRVVSIKPRQ